MHRKTLLVTVSMLMGASLLVVLLIVLNSTCVRADPSLVPLVDLPGDRAQRRTFGEEVTIVQPSAGDILTTTHWPTYAVEVDADVMGLEVISVSVDGGATYHEATGSLGSYTYDWGLPSEDYVEHLLAARASRSTGGPVASDPVTAYVDTILPQGAVITVPAQVESTGFTVSWSATDGSGVIAYDVEYRRGDGTSWTSWVSDSSETSQVFTDPLEGDSYTFRMQAFDKGGNPSGWVAETVQVGGVHVYLPVMVRQWAWWYQHDRYEPNDTPSQAAGPLEPDTVYEAYIWNQMDRDDYYHFTPTPLASGEVEINLTNIPDGSDYDLYVYYYSHVSGKYVQEAESYEPGNSDERVTFTPVSLRKYFVRVYPSVGFSNAQPYRLELTYGADD